MIQEIFIKKLALFMFCIDSGLLIFEFHRYQPFGLHYQKRYSALLIWHH